MEEFLRSIPAAASSPYALAAYAIAAVLFLFAGARLRVAKLILKEVRSVPSHERRRTIEIATGTVLPEHISAEQWIRHNRLRWSFLLLASLLIAALAVVIIALLNPSAGPRTGELTLRWGLEGPSFYHETEAAPNQDAANWSEAEPNATKYRYLTVMPTNGGPDEHYLQTSRHVERYLRLFDGFTRENPQGTHQSELAAYVREQDPQLADTSRDLAPRLYFDFIGVGVREYVLVTVEARTLDFSEYAGGGFIDREAPYDITLGHNPGVVRKEISEKLRFRGTGRTVLTLFSDNFYPNSGLTPMGCYTVELQFRFLADGKPLTVSTGPFKIDV